MKVKITYVSTKPVFLADARGNIKELPVGSEITPAQWAALKSDTARAKFTRIERNLAAERAAVKQARDAARYSVTVYGPDELNSIPDSAARERAHRIAAAWAVAVPQVPFAGVCCNEDRIDPEHKDNWYLLGSHWPADLPPMFTSNNRLTQECAKVLGYQPETRGYRYFTVTLRTAWDRIKAGKELFAY